MNNTIDQIRVGIDWDKDGIDWDSYDNITEYLISANWGLGMTSPRDRVASEGTASLVVNNADRVFSPEVVGPFYGKLKPNVEVYIEAKRPDPSTEWVRLWTGYLEDIEPETGNKRLTTTLSCLQGMFSIETARYTPTLLLNKTTDQIIRTMLGSWVPAGTSRWILGAGVLGSTTVLADPDDGFLFTTGKTTYPYYGEVWKDADEIANPRRVNVLNRIKDLVEIERGLFWLDRHGRANFLNRHALLAQSAGLGVDLNGDNFIAKNVEETDPLNLIADPLDLPEATYGYGISSGMISATQVSEATDYGRYAIDCSTGTGAYNGHELGRSLDGTFTHAIPVSPSTQYTVVMWVKDISNSSGVSFTLDAYDQTPAWLYSTVIPVGGVTNEYTQYSVTFTTGASSTSLLLQFKKYNDTTSVRFRTTGWMLLAGSTVPTGFNTGGRQDYLEDDLFGQVTLDLDTDANSSTYEYGTKSELINDVTVSYYTKRVITAGTILQSTEGWEVSAGESIDVNLRFSDNTQRVTPTSIDIFGAGSTITVTSGAATAVLTENDLDSVTVTITATSDAVISTITLTGDAIVSDSGADFTSEDQSSIVSYRRRHEAFDYKEMPSYAEAAGFGNDMLLRYAEPRGRITKIKIMNRDATWFQRQLEVGIGTPLLLSESQTGVSDLPSVVVGERWDWTPGSFTTNYTVTDTDTNIYWILGTSALGTNTVLGS